MLRSARHLCASRTSVRREQSLSRSFVSCRRVSASSVSPVGALNPDNESIHFSGSNYRSPYHFKPIQSAILNRELPRTNHLAVTNGNVLKIVTSGNAVQDLPHDQTRSSTISGRWLRDNCSCSQCRNQDTGQRQINVLKNNIDCNISEISLADADGTFSITFGDGHRAVFSQAQLLASKSYTTLRHRHAISQMSLWSADIATDPPTIQMDTIQRDGLGSLLANIRKWGFCFVAGMPATPEATESLLTAIGPIRNTHYGGFYDFTADLSSKDTAYTSESLEPHTDNTYFTEPAGLQALHLLSHTDGSGGESSLVDGFAAANRLYAEDRRAYDLLSLCRVHAHASGNEGISIQPSCGVPVLSHHPSGDFLEQVRWNNADRAGVDVSLDMVEQWYDAASKFDAIISDPANQYWFQLTPGKTLIFDNWRVLHGRAAFTGKRRMCGGYINRDDYISRYRMTTMSAEDIRASTVTG